MYVFMVYNMLFFYMKVPNHFHFTCPYKNAAYILCIILLGIFCTQFACMQLQKIGHMRRICAATYNIYFLQYVQNTCMHFEHMHSTCMLHMCIVHISHYAICAYAVCQLHLSFIYALCFNDIIINPQHA